MMAGGMGDAMRSPSPEVQPQQEAQTAGDGVSQEARPEEQDLHDMIVANSLSIVYPPNAEGGVSPKVMQALGVDATPVAKLASTAVAIIQSVRASAQKAGLIDKWNAEAQEKSHLDFDEVLFHAAEPVLSELAEVSETAGIHDYTEREVEQALYAGLDMYRGQAEQAGNLDKEGLKRGWSEVMQADQEGRLEDVMPGAAAHAEKMQADLDRDGKQEEG